MFSENVPDFYYRTLLLLVVRTCEMHTWLTQWSRCKMTAIVQTAFLKLVSWIKIVLFLFKFHRNVTPGPNNNNPALLQIMACGRTLRRQVTTWTNDGLLDLDELRSISRFALSNISYLPWDDKFHHHQITLSNIICGSYLRHSCCPLLFCYATPWSHCGPGMWNHWGIQWKKGVVMNPVSSPWASCQIRKIAGCACAGNAGNVFPATSG